ncbi:MAG TPA: hypothetical protein VFG20_08095 [Planctomycetaceae bacterium]|nr:hypothetical protein [Planctomycetaceae bacterium]
MVAPARHSAARTSVNTVLSLVTLLLIVGVLHGWWGLGCYFIQEHHRLLWWETVLMWTGDALALFWYLQFCGRWWLGTLTIGEQRLTDRRLPRSVWWVLGSLLMGMTAECLLAAKVTYDEYTGFQRAVPAVCQIRTVKRLAINAGPWNYQLAGTYRDAAGQLYPAVYRLREQEELALLPPAMANSIRQLQPFALPIVIDPQRPGRHWIREVGWDDPNRLHYMSFLVLVFQIVFGLAPIGMLVEAVKHRRLPWWTELHKVYPLCCEAFVFALFGGLEYYVLRRMCP